MTEYIIALLLGVGFGFTLNKAGLTTYRNIANQFRFTDMTVLEYMMTAIAVAMIGLTHSAGWDGSPSRQYLLRTSWGT